MVMGAPSRTHGLSFILKPQAMSASWRRISTREAWHPVTPVPIRPCDRAARVSAVQAVREPGGASDPVHREIV